MLAWGGLAMQAYCLHVKKGIVISTSHLLSECQVSEHITIAWTVNSVNRLVKRSKHLKDSSFHPSLTFTHASQASSSLAFVAFLTDCKWVANGQVGWRGDCCNMCF